jgi:hypothetical protein
MFRDMNEGLMQRRHMYSRTPGGLDLAKFLSRFDAIFTLNQDVFIEWAYPRRDLAELSNERWSDVQFPGMKARNGPGFSTAPNAVFDMEPEGLDPIMLQSNKQPIFKLHGSSKWTDAQGGSLMIVGGGKAEAIDRYPVLKFYSKQFDEFLSRPQTRLMVIGYSFRDNHINKPILKSARQLEIFVVDPKGVNVLDLNESRIPESAIGYPGPEPLRDALKDRVIGASRRNLAVTFGDDSVERKKLHRFFG